MKILIIRTTPNKIGLDSYNLQEIGLAKALVRKGHHCDVMYYNGKEKDTIQTLVFDEGMTVNIIWKQGFGFFYEGVYPGLKKYVKNYDVIQVTGYVGVISLWLNTHVQNKTVNYQGPYYYEKNRGDIKKAKILDRVMLPFSNRNNMVVISKSFLATKHMNNKGIYNVKTIGVGLDTSKFLDSDKIEGNEFVASLKEKKGCTKYLTYVGTLEPRRNTLFLLELFKKVSDDIDCKLIIVGKGSQEYVSKCFERLEELGMRDKVIYKNALEQKYVGELYKLSDAFVLPTNYEIFGMVMLEAMYFGIPTFTTYNGGSSMLIKENNGVVIEQLDADLWAEQILDVLKDEKKWKEISVNAKRTIKEKFTWDALVDRFIEVYNERIGNR